MADDFFLCCGKDRTCGHGIHGTVKNPIEKPFFTFLDSKIPTICGKRIDKDSKESFRCWLCGRYHVALDKNGSQIEKWPEAHGTMGTINLSSTYTELKKPKIVETKVLVQEGRYDYVDVYEEDYEYVTEIIPEHTEIDEVEEVHYETQKNGYWKPSTETVSELVKVKKTRTIYVNLGGYDNWGRSQIPKQEEYFEYENQTKQKSTLIWVEDPIKVKVKKKVNRNIIVPAQEIQKKVSKGYKMKKVYQWIPPKYETKKIIQMDESVERYRQETVVSCIKCFCPHCIDFFHCLCGCGIEKYFREYEEEIKDWCLQSGEKYLILEKFCQEHGLRNLFPGVNDFIYDYRLLRTGSFEDRFEYKSKTRNLDSSKIIKNYYQIPFLKKIFLFKKYVPLKNDKFIPIWKRK